jgi:hypothetical protein
MRATKRIDQYFTLLREVYDYFGYVEDWCVFPLHDDRDYYWFVDGGDERGMDGTLILSADEDVREQRRRWEEEMLGGDRHYENPIYTQRHLPRWIWRADRYTMVLVDTYTDGNKWLSVLDNGKER